MTACGSRAGSWGKGIGADDEARRISIQGQASNRIQIDC